MKRNITYLLLTVLVLLAGTGHVKAQSSVASDAAAYYLVGDWNNWNLENKSFKLQPVYGQQGVYMIYINAPINAKDGYALRFVVNPSGNTSDWNAVLRPSTGGDYELGGSYYSDATDASCYSGNYTAAWKLYESGARDTQNGGSYLLTINTNTGKWSIKNTHDIRVLYMIRSDKDWQFDGDYLYDINTEGITNYNNNYVGTVEMASGITYKLTDGYHWYGSTDGKLTYNARTDITSQEEIQVEGDNNIPFNLAPKVYSVEANVVVLNDNETYSYSASRKNVIWTDATKADWKINKVQIKSATMSQYEDMTYDGTNKLWYYSGLVLGNSEEVKFKEFIYDGNNGKQIEVAPIYNDEKGQGTYKAVYVEGKVTGGEAIKKLLLSTLISKVGNKYIRTFSDHYARVIPDGLTAYYAMDYKATTDENGNTTAATINLAHITDGVIPAETGVILIYDGTSTGINYDGYAGGIASWASLEKAETTGTPPRNNGTEPNGYGADDGGRGKNWLVALLTDGTETGPITKQTVGNKEVVTYRNYYLTVINGTLGFYRSKYEAAASTPKNLRKAYLALPSSVQKDSEFDCAGFETDDALGSKQICLAFDEVWDSEGETTPITSLVTTSKRHDECYYTLQGMRVERPQKGIYIYKGKKVVLK